MHALQGWKVTPFDPIAIEPAGMAGGVAPAANGLVFIQSASYNMVRSLSASHDLALRQSDYLVETASNALALADAATWGNERPVSASSNLSISGGVAVSGGQHNSPIHVITAEGIILAGQVIYIKSNGNAVIALADAAATADAVGLAVANGGGIVTGTLYYRTFDALTLDDWTHVIGSADLTPGAIYYLSDADDGELVTTAPTGDGSIAIKIGTALTARTFNIEIGEGVAL